MRFSATVVRWEQAYAGRSRGGRPRCCLELGSWRRSLSFRSFPDIGIAWEAPVREFMHMPTAETASVASMPISHIDRKRSERQIGGFRAGHVDEHAVLEVLKLRARVMLHVMMVVSQAVLRDGDGGALRAHRARYGASDATQGGACACAHHRGACGGACDRTHGGERKKRTRIARVDRNKATRELLPLECPSP